MRSEVFIHPWNPDTLSKISSFILWCPRGVLVAARSAANRCCSPNSINVDDVSEGNSANAGAQCSWAVHSNCCKEDSGSCWLVIGDIAGDDMMPTCRPLAPRRTVLKRGGR